MNKKRIYIVIIVSLVLIILSFFYYRHYKITHVSNHYTLVSNLKVEYGSKIYPSNFIENIKGKIIDEKLVDTYSLGTTQVKFYFINEYEKKVSSTFNLEVVDTTAPLIWISNSYSIPVNYAGNLEADILCADNYERNIKCTITGVYDVKTVGSYPLTIGATDSSNNSVNMDFILYVNEPATNTEEIIPTEFSEIIANYKTDQTKIGIDVSKWQGDIDWQKVKQAGVEFVIIKVGGQDGIDGDNYLDSHFEDNIKGATSVGIEVGIYYFSYARTISEATNQVNWIIKQIKDYDINLPIAFDWEIWSQFNYLDINLIDLNLIAESYLKEVISEGYSTMLYSSKNRLEKIWAIYEYPIWLAHYTKETNYQGDFVFWQVSSTSHVDGIDDNYVDVDIMYLNK